MIRFFIYLRLWDLAPWMQRCIPTRCKLPYLSFKCALPNIIIPGVAVNLGHNLTVHPTFMPRFTNCYTSSIMVMNRRAHWLTCLYTWLVILVFCCSLLLLCQFWYFVRWLYLSVCQAEENARNAYQNSLEEQKPEPKAQPPPVQPKPVSPPPEETPKGTYDMKEPGAPEILLQT